MLPSMPTPHHENRHRAASLLLLAGALVLALKPAWWLVGTWHEQGYDGIGWIAFVLVAGLFGWSLASPLRIDTARHDPVPRMLALLAATALLRLAAQLLDVNVLGALLLVVDVYALARLARLDRRQRAVAPFWLAVVFAFSLPIEPMLQRLCGYPLQHASAHLAWTLLAPFFDHLALDGVRLSVDGMDVLVDLPCSGAETVSLVGLLFALASTLRRPTAAAGALGTLACLLLALLGNGVRIALLAAGIARPGDLPFHVMDPVPHTLIGLSVVGLVTLALLAFTHRLPVAPERPAPSRQTPAERPGIRSSSIMWITGYPVRLLSSLCFLLFALSVGAIQPRPVDSSLPVSSPLVPRFAAGFFSEQTALSAQERRYFERYGGSATRARFGPFGLLLVSTTSPLRHLHDPTICLGGMGYDVRLIGTDHATGSTLYRAGRAGGQGYLVRVSYLSSTGQTATSIAEVVWLWLRAPARRWTMVQRIIPLHPDVEPATAAEWDAAMRRAFNLS